MITITDEDRRHDEKIPSKNENSPAEVIIDNNNANIAATSLEVRTGDESDDLNDVSGVEPIVIVLFMFFGLGIGIVIMQLLSLVGGYIFSYGHYPSYWMTSHP